MRFHQEDEIRKIFSSAGIACAALTLAPVAGADPTVGHDAKVQVQTPPMLCEIGSDDADPEVGPNVVCQGAFPQSPMNPIPWPDWVGDPSILHQNQAVVTASGQFSYRDANIGVGYDHPSFETLVPGQTYQIQGWTIRAGEGGITFTRDDSGHGMTIGGDRSVNPF
ncbi:hypothetical protein [Mycobacterium paraffinicum]|uniref:Uncharacterized protein n=1 Tax=Mycobacterium paraffinicum TaxID=53378 RepID=A0ABP8RII3_9MYCO|nr:hypothetical protein [Mycobacterium paraffinicum]MCV7309196.1 hypothetical protein [Mycobacterium paraffinicum]